MQAVRHAERFFRGLAQAGVFEVGRQAMGSVGGEHRV
jgi:hypothetical protein